MKYNLPGLTLLAKSEIAFYISVSAFGHPGTAVRSFSIIVFSFFR